MKPRVDAVASHMVQLERQVGAVPVADDPEPQPGLAADVEGATRSRPSPGATSSHRTAGRDKRRAPIAIASGAGRTTADSKGWRQRGLDSSLQRREVQAAAEAPQKAVHRITRPVIREQVFLKGGQAVAARPWLPPRRRQRRPPPEPTAADATPCRCPRSPPLPLRRQRGPKDGSLSTVERFGVQAEGGGALPADAALDNHGSPVAQQQFPLAAAGTVNLEPQQSLAVAVGRAAGSPERENR